MNIYGFNNHRAPQAKFESGPMGFAPSPHHAYTNYVPINNLYTISFFLKKKKITCTNMAHTPH